MNDTLSLFGGPHSVAGHTVEFNGDDWALIEAIAKLSTGHTVCTAVRCASPLPAAVSVIAVDMSLARPIHSKTDAKENQ